MREPQIFFRVSVVFMVVFVLPYCQLLCNMSQETIALCCITHANIQNVTPALSQLGNVSVLISAAHTV